MLKLACTLHNLAKVCLPRFPSAKIQHFIGSNKDLPEKYRKEMVGRSSMVLTRKTVVDETLVCMFSDVCISIVGMNVSQLTRFLCVQPCHRNFLPDKKSMKVCKNSNIHKARKTALNKKSFFSQKQCDFKKELLQHRNSEKVSLFRYKLLLRDLQHCVSSLGSFLLFYHDCRFLLNLE